MHCPVIGLSYLPTEVGNSPNSLEQKGKSTRQLLAPLAAVFSPPTGDSAHDRIRARISRKNGSRHQILNLQNVLKKGSSNIWLFSQPHCIF